MKLTRTLASTALLSCLITVSSWADEEVCPIEKVDTHGLHCVYKALCCPGEPVTYTAPPQVDLADSCGDEGCQDTIKPRFQQSGDAFLDLLFTNEAFLGEIEKAGVSALATFTKSSIEFSDASDFQGLVDALRDRNKIVETRATLAPALKHFKPVYDMVRSEADSQNSDSGDSALMFSRSKDAPEPGEIRQRSFHAFQSEMERFGYGPTKLKYRKLSKIQSDLTPGKGYKAICEIVVRFIHPKTKYEVHAQLVLVQLPEFTAGEDYSARQLAYGYEIDKKSAMDSGVKIHKISANDFEFPPECDRHCFVVNFGAIYYGVTLAQHRFKP